ncbi:MAG TPA: hypothetical protein DHV90_00575 [Lactobacillus sp.]|nr:MAG TPA: hypothetical protein [Caudoviricetes sp.]HCI89258.1 hypothetical protein [Lactobacillus sp.]
MSELRKGRMKMKFDYASLDCKPGVIAVAPPWTLWSGDSVVMDKDSPMYKVKHCTTLEDDSEAVLMLKDLADLHDVSAIITDKGERIDVPDENYLSDMRYEFAGPWIADLACIDDDIDDLRHKLDAVVQRNVFSKEIDIEAGMSDVYGLWRRSLTIMSAVNRYMYTVNHQNGGERK